MAIPIKNFETGHAVFRGLGPLTDCELVDFCSKFGALSGDNNYGAVVADISWRPVELESRYLHKSLRMPFHTDSASTRNPHRWIGLFCVRPDVVGAGHSLLLDGMEIVESVIKRQPWLKTVAQEGMAFLNRAAQGPAVHLPVYSRQSGERLVRYRRDLMRPMQKRQFSLIRAIEAEIARREPMEVILDAGDLLVIDNHRMLHSRTPISQSTKRRVKRVKLR